MVIDEGMTQDFTLSHAESLTIMTFLAVSMYNTLELIVMIFMYFKRRKSLYFWSLLISTIGIIIYALGFFAKFFKVNIISHGMVVATCIVVGWSSMVTGQSLVLYSRLHLVMGDRKKLKYVLIMIIVDAILCHIPVGVLVYASNTPDREPFLPAYAIYEKVQVTIFFIQECIISGLYVWKTAQMLQLEENILRKNVHHMMTHLLWMNVLIIIMDITLLSVEYAGYYFIQTTYKAATYSVKLKMEFSVLNRLIRLVNGNRNPDASLSNPSDNDHRMYPFGIGNLANSWEGSRDVGVVTSIALGPYKKIRNKETHHPGPSLMDMGGVLKTTDVTVAHSKMTSNVDDAEITEDNNVSDKRHRADQSAKNS